MVWTSPGWVGLTGEGSCTSDQAVFGAGSFSKPLGAAAFWVVVQEIMKRHIAGPHAAILNFVIVVMGFI
jgi:hypothetical protein